MSNPKTQIEGSLLLSVLFPIRNPNPRDIIPKSQPLLHAMALPPFNHCNNPKL